MKPKIRKHHERIENELNGSLNTADSPVKLAKSLKKIYTHDVGLFFSNLAKLPTGMLAEVLLEFPNELLKDSIGRLPQYRIAASIEKLESDDTTDLMQKIDIVDTEYAKRLLMLLHPQDRRDVEELSKYSSDQAGAYMEREFLAATIDETVSQVKERIRKFRKEEPVSPIIKLFVVDDEGILIGSVHFSDLILFEPEDTLRYVMDKLRRRRPLTIRPSLPIEEVVRLFEDYDLNIIAVVNKENKLIGRIVYDDIYDMIRQMDTEQAYSLAGVDDEAEEESLIAAAKKRLLWLFVNLGTILAASAVIDFYDQAIASYVALAVLLPVVAALGGNAGMQALTVTIRRIALGEIDYSNAKTVLRRESLIVLGNGFIIGAATGIVTYIWFDNLILSTIVVAAIFLNLLLAGSAGALIPLALKKVGIDPAIASSIFLTTTSDVFGFFIFLSLAQLFLT